MNLSLLKSSYPLAFKELEVWVEKKFETPLALWNGTVRMEDVIYFLDDKNINVQISVKCALDGSRWYLAYIWSDSDGCDIDDHMPDCMTRSISTALAITKSFHILEQKLKLN